MLSFFAKKNALCKKYIYWWGKMRIINVLLLILGVVLFTGCATRPPSSMFFMESYHKKETDPFNLGVSFTANLPSIYTYDHEEKKDNNIYEYEIPVDMSVQLCFPLKSHFLWGMGVFLGDGFAYAGFAWDHFGVMAWSDFGGWFAMIPASGLSTIEQIHIGKDISLGISQHLEFNWFVSDYRTEFYKEYAGGLYLLKRRGVDKKTVGLEFRYGRIFSDRASLDGNSHLAISLSFI